MNGHRGVNRSPNIPTELWDLFRQTSKQEWAEIAFDFALQQVGGDEANWWGPVRAELLRRREIARTTERQRKAERAGTNVPPRAIAGPPEGIGGLRPDPLLCPDCERPRAASRHLTKSITCDNESHRHPRHCPLPHGQNGQSDDGECSESCDWCRSRELMDPTPTQGA